MNKEMPYLFQKEWKRGMELSKEEHITVLACLIGIFIMFLEKVYGKDMIPLLIVPVGMLLYVRQVLKNKNKKNKKY